MRSILRYSTTLLLTIILGVSGLSYVVFDLAQVEFHSISKTELATERTTETIHIPLSDFKARPDDDEIWVNGSLYDIGSYTIEGDQVSITVYHDETEESFVGLLTTGFESGSSIDNSGHSDHISKHKLHNSDNGKIIPQKWTCRSVEKAGFDLHFPDCPDYLFLNFATSVIKPPPRC